MNMDLYARLLQLCEVFSCERRAEIGDVRLGIQPFRFKQSAYQTELHDLQRELATTGFCPLTDNCIEENTSFNYAVFTPQGHDRKDKAILLLHGLNEHCWNKYLTWAESLAKDTGRAVILFPIAFHMNRIPRLWINPRTVWPWVTARKAELQPGEVSNSTFINLALSSRISKQPLRFYISGLQSAYNIVQLVQEIKNGEHPLFKEGTSVNFFAYSIGALLSQVLLLANPDELFSDSRLFMFCGGSIFSRMNGNARDIMDKQASDRLMDYYVNTFLQSDPIGHSQKSLTIEEAFKMLIRPEVMKRQRESFFESAADRIRAISLKNDTVMPTEGIGQSLGRISGKILEELDFAFPYSHQKPFPTNIKKDREMVNEAFGTVFDRAAAFLC